MAVQSKINASTPFERFAHWVLAISCLLLLVTGLGLLFKSWSWIAALFGGGWALKLVHDVAAWFFMAGLAMGFSVWSKDCLSFDEEDNKWFAKMGGYLQREPLHFNLYKFNPGQKLFFIWVIVGGIIMSLTGLALMFPESMSRGLVQFAGALHVLVMITMALFIIIHIYLGTIGNPGSVSAILSGKVSRAWARTHRPRWLEKHPNGL
jgi:formate dehydrogenase subunit gamma